MESVAVVIRDGMEDPLDDTGMVSQQLDQLSVIGTMRIRKDVRPSCATLRHRGDHLSGNDWPKQRQQDRRDDPGRSIVVAGVHHRGRGRGPYLLQ